MKILSAVLIVAALAAALAVHSSAAPSSRPTVGVRLPDPTADGRAVLPGPLPDSSEPLVQPAFEDPPPPATPPDAGYLIVTGAPLVGQFERLAAWKRRQGTPAEVRTLASIRRDHPIAFDDAERIRLAIRDAHARGVRWVLLGGDTEVVPTRIVRSTLLEDQAPEYADFPSDHYFACLDGSWNADGDGHFGEAPRFGDPGDDVDLTPEVFVGRAPVRTAAEAKVFVDKTIDYAEGRAVPASRRTLFMAEVLLPKPWRGERPDLDLARHVDFLLRFPPPSSLEAVRLYENHDDPDYLPGALRENQASVLEHLNRGYPLSVFLGSASRTVMSVGPDWLENHEVVALGNREALTNFLHAASCLTHDVAVDCIAEEFLRDPDGGAVTSLGPTNLQFVGQSVRALTGYLSLFASGQARTAGELSAWHRQGSGPDYAMGTLLLGDPQLRIVPGADVARARKRGSMRDEGASAALAAASARPNPARDRVAIEVDLGAGARPAAIRAEVFDLNGRRVRALENATVAGGRLAATWDLKDGVGRRVDEGVYFVSVRIGEAKRVMRLLVVR